MVMFRFSCLFSMLLMLAACSPMTHHQGKKLNPEDMQKVQVERHNKQDVVKILGTPSLKSSYAGEKWYYVYKVTETVAFLEPETVESEVVEVSFDGTGLVKNIQKAELTENNVTLVERVTPTSGHQMSVMQQIFGNFGRFSREGAKGPPSTS